MSDDIDIDLGDDIADPDDCECEGSGVCWNCHGAGCLECNGTGVCPDCGPIELLNA